MTNPTEQPETTSPPIDTPSEGDAQPVDVETDIVHCVECLWWVSGENADEGKCHRYAPRPTTKRPGVVWPTTGSADFCGESKLKPEPLTPSNAIDAA